MMHKAKCRHCGTRVSFFGEICEPCLDTYESKDDFLTRLNNECDAIIMERMDNT